VLPTLIPLPILWLSPDPHGTATRLCGQLGLPVAALLARPAATVPRAEDGRAGAGGTATVFAIDLAGGRIEFAPVPAAAGYRSDEERLALPDEPGRPATDHDSVRGSPILLGVGWATVDLDRAAAQLGAPPGRIADDRLLGARCMVVPGSPALLLLEPATEGRIAASLARWGEGPAVLYVGFAGSGATGLSMHLEAVRGRVGRLSAPALGPFGSAVAIAGGPPWGPHLVFTEADVAGPSAGTIGP